MSFIKLNIREQVSTDGRSVRTTIRGLESDMADIHNNEINIIAHALSANRQYVFMLNKSKLNNQSNVLL